MRILIAEDDYASRKFLTNLLSEYGECDQVVDGMEATEAFYIALESKNPYTLVCLDIMMPKMDGFELCRKLKTDERTSHIPVVLLTARAESKDKIEGLETGADDYVVKPFSPRELTARIKAVLRRTRQPATDPPSNQAFQIDASRRRIFYFDTALDLSRYEYNLLKVLIRRPGHVFTRDHLMELAWDEPEASMDRTVDAHVKNIRAKLKSIKPDIDPIATHRGVGYALKEDL